MKIIRNIGSERVVDEVRGAQAPVQSIDVMSQSFSLNAFTELSGLLESAERCRLLLAETDIANDLFGGASDIGYRATLQNRWRASTAANWLQKTADVRLAPSNLPQSLIVMRSSNALQALLGTCSFSTEGLGLTPSAGIGLVQSSENSDEAAAFADWFQWNWERLGAGDSAKAKLSAILSEAGSHRAPSLVYFQTLYTLFKELGDELDEEEAVNDQAGIPYSGYPCLIVQPSYPSRAAVLAFVEPRVPRCRRKADAARASFDARRALMYQCLRLAGS